VNAFKGTDAALSAALGLLDKALAPARYQPAHEQRKLHYAQVVAHGREYSVAFRLSDGVEFESIFEIAKGGRRVEPDRLSPTVLAEIGRACVDHLDAVYDQQQTQDRGGRR